MTGSNVLRGINENMKKGAEPKKPMNWLPILAVVVPCLWGLSVWIRDWPLAVIAAAMSVYLMLDVWNLVSRKRAASEHSKSSKPKEPRG
jgi:hypothetical protein